MRLAIKSETIIRQISELSKNHSISLLEFKDWLIDDDDDDSIPIVGNCKCSQKKNRTNNQRQRNQGTINDDEKTEENMLVQKHTTR